MRSRKRTALAFDRRAVSASAGRAAVNKVDDLRGLGKCHQQAFLRGFGEVSPTSVFAEQAAPSFRENRSSCTRRHCLPICIDHVFLTLFKAYTRRTRSIWLSFFDPLSPKCFFFNKMQRKCCFGKMYMV